MLIYKKRKNKFYFYNYILVKIKSKLICSILIYEEKKEKNFYNWI